LTLYKGLYKLADVNNERNGMTGENIKAIRQQCGETQERFARRLRVSFVTINRWENNLARPSDLAIRRLNRLFRKLEDSKMENH
jgi:DNA-binding transcriptional regulator YiaG